MPPSILMGVAADTFNLRGQSLEIGEAEFAEGSDRATMSGRGGGASAAAGLAVHPGSRLLVETSGGGDEKSGGGNSRENARF